MNRAQLGDLFKKNNWKWNVQVKSLTTLGQRICLVALKNKEEL